MTQEEKQEVVAVVQDMLMVYRNLSNSLGSYQTAWAGKYAQKARDLVRKLQADELQTTANT